MPKNVMKLLKPSPHRQRNDFDLSHRHVYDANFGELLPATCIETVPGDNITLRASDLIRAIPFVNSPFLRAKQHLDVWFVPYHDLWHQFDAFITSKTEPVSAAFNHASYLPHTTQYDLNDAINYSGTWTDVVGRNIKARSFYLLELLGYGDVKDSPGSSRATSFSVNPFRLAAYNYIWYNEYRQQYYDDGTRLLAASQNAANLFNFDDLLCSSVSDSAISSNSGNNVYRLMAMCQMRYRCWKKDLFTGVLPSTQFGNVSLVTNDTYVYLGASGQIANVAGAAGPAAINKGEIFFYSGGNANYPGQANPLTIGNLDVLSLRKSEAIQIWRENALRAGNHIKDNMMAHYGVESDFDDHRPTYLGSVSAPLNIGDIAATATTGTGVNDKVGDIAGKGLSSLDEKVFKFHAKDFGVIMVMFSMLPEAEYDGLGIDRSNQLLEREDFFIPEYENLGLEAVSTINLSPRTNGNISDAYVYGYAPRYYAYKTKLDKVFGQFCGTGVFRTWSSQRSDMTNVIASAVYGTSLPLSLLYVNPSVFDINFNVGLSTSPQFLVDQYFDIDAVRPMSVTGMPFS